MSDDFFDEFEDLDDEFLAAWEQAEHEAAAVVRRALPADRLLTAPEAALRGAAAGLRAAAGRGDRGAQWMLQAAGIDSVHDHLDDAQLLVQAVAATVSMVHESGLPAEEEAAIFSLELADWVGAVTELVLEGPGASADPTELVGRIAHSPYVESGDLDPGDELFVEHAFELILPAWEAAGVVDRDRTLTEAGAWVLPRAVCRAWGSDFETPQDPAAESWRVPLFEPHDELDDHEQNVLDQALAILRAETMAGIADLAARLDPPTDSDTVLLVFNEHSDALLLENDRVVHLPDLLDGVMLTHRLTEAELADQALSVYPDLALLHIIPRPHIPLAGGGTCGVRYRDAGDFTTGLVGPDGWLDGFAPGDVLGVRYAGGQLYLEHAEPDEDVGELLADRLAETLDLLGPTTAIGGPLDVPELVVETLARAPLALRRPAPPLGELLDEIGFDLGPDGSVDTSPHPDSWRERTQAVYDLDDDGMEAVALCLGYLRYGVEHLAPAQVAALAYGLSHGRTAELLADQVATAQENLAAEGVALAELLTVHGEREHRAAAFYLLARCAEQLGRTEAAEDALRDALAADPDYVPALLDAAWYAEDRGEAQRALGYLRHAGVTGDDEQLARLERWARPGEAAAGRNDPCPCGSGRKYKVCCSRRGGHSLDERTEWVLDKAIQYAERPAQRDVMAGLVRARTAGLRDPERFVAAFRDRLVPDLALFEEGLLADFLDARGVLVPADELELARSWAGTARSLYEVVAADPSEGVDLLDLRSGARLTVTDPLGSQGLRAGETVFARVLPDGRGHRLTAGTVIVPVEHRESLLALLDDEPSATELAAWVGALHAPPRVTNTEGEPMLFHDAVYRLGDTTLAAKALAGRFDDLGGGRFSDTAEVDGETITRSVLTVGEDQLWVSTNSAIRWQRVSVELAELLPDGELVDLTRRSIDDLRAMGVGGDGLPEDVPPELLDLG